MLLFHEMTQTIRRGTLTENMGKLLGVDYGTKHVGLALSDDTEHLAFPYATFNNDSALLENIMAVIKEQSIVAVVIGESITYKRKENPLMEKIRSFKSLLEQKAHLTVYFEPEWMTTVEARRTMNTPKLVDASAAALILQRYLDRAAQKNTTS